MDINLLSTDFQVRKLDENDVDAIYSVSRENKIFYQYHPPFVTKESIKEDIEALPPNKSFKISIISDFSIMKSLLQLWI